VIELGWKTLGEIDQRAYHDQPEAMAAAVMAIIDAQTHETAPHSAPSPYRQELTPEGVQYVIPGCERVPVAKSGAAQLSLF